MVYFPLNSTHTFQRITPLDSCSSEVRISHQTRWTTSIGQRCVLDAGGGRNPRWPSATLQCSGPAAAHASCLAPAVTQQKLCALHPAERACWGAYEKYQNITTLQMTQCERCSVNPLLVVCQFYSLFRLDLVSRFRLGLGLG